MEETGSHPFVVSDHLAFHPGDYLNDWIFLPRKRYTVRIPDTVPLKVKDEEVKSTNPAPAKNNEDRRIILKPKY